MSTGSRKMPSWAMVTASIDTESFVIIPKTDPSDTPNHHVMQR